MAVHRGASPHSLVAALHQIVSHGTVTIAVALDFSPPGLANYILNERLPGIESNALGFPRLRLLRRRRCCVGSTAPRSTRLRSAP